MVVFGGAAVIAAYASARVELLYVGVLAILVPVFAIAFARFRRVSVSASRSFSPAIVAAGQPTMVDLLVVNEAPMPSAELTWRDLRAWSGGGVRSGMLPPLTARRSRHIAPGNSTRLRYEIVPPRRGIFEIGPMTVVIGDPFGLALGEVTVAGTDRLVVTPRLATLPDTGLAILASDGASMLVRRAIGGEDDLSTREYRTGDALRRVHWRATARHGELMVRQEDPRSHAEARVIVDTRRSGYLDTLPLRGPDESESESFELALSLATSIALHLARGGFAVEVVETAARQLDPVAALEEFFDSLASIELSDEIGAMSGDSALAASASL